MGRYLIRRVIISIITLICISVVIFSILALAPGDPLSGFRRKSECARGAASADARADGNRRSRAGAIRPLGVAVPARATGASRTRAAATRATM